MNSCANGYAKKRFLLQQDMIFSDCYMYQKAVYYEIVLSMA
jgi:hypothetical protein